MYTANFWEHQQRRENPVSLTIGIPATYDFSNLITKAYGNNMKMIDSSPLRFGIFSGDENQDDVIDVADLVDIYNDGLNLASGYLKTDINGDNFIDVSDLVIAYNNSINVVGIIRP